jgi:hypothetical protein
LIKNLRIPIIAFSIIIIVVFALHFFEIIDDITQSSILYAVLNTLINFILITLFFHRAHNKSNKIFLIYNIGGMGIRVLIMLILVFLTIKFLIVDEFKYIFAFFLFYILFLIYEINIIRLKVEKPKVQKDTENVVQ